MTESEWLASEDPAAMLRLLGEETPFGAERRHPVSDRKYRLFAVAMVRQVWRPLNSSDRLAYERLERYCDSGDRADLGDSWVWPLTPAAEYARRLSACLGGEVPPGDFNLPGKVRADLLRGIVGNPFRRIAFDPAWRTPDVLSLARAAYEERPGRKCRTCDGRGWYRDGPDYNRTRERCKECNRTGRIEDGTLDPARLAVLSDALEEVGCDDQHLLRHLRGWVACPICHGGGWLMDRVPVVRCHNCRGGGVVRDLANLPKHVRGCWAIDLLLGKE